MKATRTALITAVAIGLLAGSTVGVSAQEASPEPAVSPSPVPLEVEPVSKPLPVADYWGEWTLHKLASRGRVAAAAQHASRAKSKKVGFYRDLVSVHADELLWLSRHRPADCYVAEYERWRTAVGELHEASKRAVKTARQDNRKGLQRVMKQHRAGVRDLDRLLSNVADCVDTTTAPAPAIDPFVGDWLTRSTEVGTDGLVVQRLKRVSIGDGGQLLWQHPRNLYCKREGHGLVTFTVHGQGQTVTDGTPRFQWTGGRMDCHPKGKRRVLMAHHPGNVWDYDASADVMLDHDAQCYWRKKGGSPKDCKAFWRGTPAPVSRFLPREVAGEQLVVGNLSPQDVMGGFGGGEALRDLLLPYGKVPSDVLVAFGRNDRRILMYAMRVEGMASDELAGVVIEAQRGNLPPSASLTTETIGERAVTVVRDTDGSEVFGAILYPTDEVLFLITVPDETLVGDEPDGRLQASVTMEDVLAELP